MSRLAAQKINGETPNVSPSLAGEDFSRFLENYPGAFIWLGTQIDIPEEQAPLHDAHFKLNERALPIGTSLLVQVAIDTLEKLAKEENE
ncbi:M20/M25/M40 family metallo-hydrolase [Virgibacillus salarius]|uniref:M20/M25/M40 family metallo-hydrolase n=1 Tax=Virgibacillus salarius TaxID=447199 RepID=UPI0031E61A00